MNDEAAFRLGRNLGRLSCIIDDLKGVPDGTPAKLTLLSLAEILKETNEILLSDATARK